MFTQEQYLWGWLWYLLGVGMCMAVFWVMTHRIPWRELRYSLRVLVASIFLVPWYVGEGESYLAPAWIASALEGAFDGPDAFWRAGTPLVVSTISALILSTIVFAVLFVLDKRRANG